MSERPNLPVLDEDRWDLTLLPVLQDAQDSLDTHDADIAGHTGELADHEARVTAAEGYAARPPAYNGLDLWAAFDATGGAESWAASSYSDWIAGLAAHFASEITAGTVTVADLGESSAAGKRVYAYTAGTGPYEVLIVSGQHGAERLGQWAAMRWFEGFVRSGHPSYAALRRLLTVTWIPTANPHNYGTGRKNANGVDLNRNYDLFWSQYTDSDPSSDSYKGGSAASEPETQMIRDLLTTHDYRVVLDCHNFNSGSDEGQLALPGPWLLGARRFGLDVRQAWSSLYGAGYTLSLVNERQTFPMLVNYANYVMRHVNGRLDAAAVTLEMNANAGSSTTTEITAAGMSAYAGLIHTYLGLWAARVGDPLSLPSTYQVWAVRSAQSDSTSVASGGALVDTGSGTYTPLMWGDRQPATSTNSGETLPIPIIAAPAFVTFHLDARMTTLGNGAGRFEFTVEIDGVSNVYTAVITTGATSGDMAVCAVSCCKLYPSVSNTTIPSARVLVRKISGGACALRTVTLLATISPYATDSAIPVTV